MRFQPFCFSLSYFTLWNLFPSVCGITVPCLNLPILLNIVLYAWSYLSHASWDYISLAIWDGIVSHLRQYLVGDVSYLCLNAWFLNYVNVPCYGFVVLLFLQCWSIIVPGFGFDNCSCSVTIHRTHQELCKRLCVIRAKHPRVVCLVRCLSKCWLNWASHLRRSPHEQQLDGARWHMNYMFSLYYLENLELLWFWKIWSCNFICWPESTFDPFRGSKVQSRLFSTRWAAGSGRWNLKDPTK